MAEAETDPVVAYWDNFYSTPLRTELYEGEQKALDEALAFFGDIKGKRIVDLGCGEGLISLRFAELGAEVFAIDISPVAIDKLTKTARQRGLSNLHAICADMTHLSELGKFDLIFGMMILHHIEPFSAFAEQLSKSLSPRGRAFFAENNACSRLLVWFRQNVVGKFWIPKHGDPHEFPLTPDEVGTLRKYFHVDQRYPTMLFFGLIGIYLFREKVMRPFARLDAFCLRHRILVCYSYRQSLCLDLR